MRKEEMYDVSSQCLPCHVSFYPINRREWKYKHLQTLNSVLTFRAARWFPSTIHVRIVSLMLESTKIGCFVVTSNSCCILQLINIEHYHPKITWNPKIYISNQKKKYPALWSTRQEDFVWQSPITQCHASPTVAKEVFI